jgi:hypothetical protein
MLHLYVSLIILGCFINSSDSIASHDFEWCVDRDEVREVALGWQDSEKIRKTSTRGANLVSGIEAWDVLNTTLRYSVLLCQVQTFVLILFLTVANISQSSVRQQFVLRMATASKTIINRRDPTWVLLNYRCCDFTNCLISHTDNSYNCSANQMNVYIVYHL